MHCKCNETKFNKFLRFFKNYAKDVDMSVFVSQNSCKSTKMSQDLQHLPIVTNLCQCERDVFNNLSFLKSYSISSRKPHEWDTCYLTNARTYYTINSRPSACTSSLSARHFFTHVFGQSMMGNVRPEKSYLGIFSYLVVW